MEGLRCLVASMDGPRVVAAKTNVEDAVAAVREFLPSILAVAKTFGARTVTDWVRLLSSPETPVAVIGWGSPMWESRALRFLQAGAHGVIRKDASLADLPACVRAVAARRRRRSDPNLLSATPTCCECREPSA